MPKGSRGGSRAGSSGSAGAGQEQATQARNTKEVRGFVSEQAERLKKMPQKGEKVQAEFIDYVKQMTNIDLNTARDTMFDNRNYFNIDVRDLSKSGRNVTSGENVLNQVRNLSSGNFDFSIESNGVTRYAIRVTNKHYKKKK